ncbi:MAG: casA [Firmicutes bacterium]|nr:casA [Bacillota bacterium]
MNISSISNKWASELITSMRNNAKNNTNDTSTNNLDGVVYSNADGDTFQITTRMYKEPGELAAYLYNKLDTNEDDSLTIEEFSSAFGNVITDEMSEKIYESMDAEGDGLVSITEFSTAFVTALESEHPPFEEQLKEEEKGTITTINSSKVMLAHLKSFISMDTDGDGLLSVAEFSAARPSDITEAMSQKLFDSFDTDASSSLTESEYETAMSNAPSDKVTVSSTTKV